MAVSAIGRDGWTWCSRSRFRSRGAEAITVLMDPAAHRAKGIYFHYAKDGKAAHSGLAKGAVWLKALPDREWLIRVYGTGGS